MSETIEQIRSYLHNWQWCAEKSPELEKFIQERVFVGDGHGDKAQCVWHTRTRAVEILDFKGSDGKVIKMAFKHDCNRRFLRYFINPSHALKEFRGYQTAKRLGFSCADVLACGDIRHFGKLKQSYFVTRLLEDSYQMREYEQGRSHQDDHSELLALLRVVLGQLAVLHKAGYRHGGAHSWNFLCRKEADDKVRVYWIDLVTLRKFSIFHRRSEILRDLCYLIEFFDLSDSELAELQRLYNSVSENNVRFERIQGKDKRLNRAIWAR